MSLRLAGASGVLAGVLLAAGYVAFWQLVPSEDQAREEDRTLVIAVGLTWLIAHLAIAPALVGLHSRQFQVTGALGGFGVALSVAGTLGLALATLRVFPELVGLDTDTIQEARLTVLLQAIGELSVVSFLSGLLLLGLATVRANRFPVLAGIAFIAGSVLAPMAVVQEGLLALAAVVVGAGLVMIGLALLTGNRRAVAGRGTGGRPARQGVSSFWHSR